jgi:hypothetical protein
MPLHRIDIELVRYSQRGAIYREFQAGQVEDAAPDMRPRVPVSRPLWPRWITPARPLTTSN